MVLLMGQEYTFNYMLKLIKSFYFNKVNDFMFIKHYNTMCLPVDTINEIIGESGKNYHLLYHKYSKHQMLEAYQPFLGWIPRLYQVYFKDETPEEFVKNAGVYPLMQSTFAHYIQTGKADRTEDILVNELAYEEKKALVSLGNIYKYICLRANLFIVIENLHLANLSGVKALYNFLSINCHGKLRVFASYNESYHIPDYIKDTWNLFIEDVEKYNYHFEWGEVNTNITLDAQDVFLPVANCMEEYITLARNMYFFICYEDACYYLDTIYDKIKHSNLMVTQEQYSRLLQLLALAKLHSKDYSRALQLCELIGTIAYQNNDNKLLYNYNYLCAMNQYGMEQLENKLTGYVEKCMSIARENGDELAEYKPQILQLLSDCNYWRDIYIDYYDNYVSEEFLQKTLHFGFKNILAYIYIYCFNESDEVLYRVARYEEELPYFEKGVALATEIENYELLISAYTKNIILFSRIGCHEYLDILYEKKISAVEIEHNPTRMIHTYNGMGYNAGITEKYQRAEEYFSLCFEHLLKQDSGEEIAITLYNSAYNKMLAREYAYAAEDLLLLLKIMDKLNIHALSIADTARFYAMLGICCFYTGEDYRCCYCLNKIDTYVCHLNHVNNDNKYHYWIDTLFMKYLLEAMIFVQDGKCDEAKIKFDLAEYIMNMDKEKKYFSYLLYIHEIAKYYDYIGDEENRQRVLQDGINFCEKNGYNQRSSILTAELTRGHEFGRKRLILKRRVTEDDILNTIENIVLKKKIECRKKDISFLTIWQELLSKCNHHEEVMPQAFNLLKNNFNFDGVFMIGLKSGNAYIEYKDCPPKSKSIDNVSALVYNYTQDALNGIVNYFRENMNAILISRIDKGFLEYKKLLDIIGIHQVVTLFAAPLFNADGFLDQVLIGYVEMRKYAIPNRYLLNEDDYTILKFASEQLHNALEKLKYTELIQKMNGQLSNMAVTDQLTGLYNRQGFEKLMNEWGMYKKLQKVIVYMDMDNFKYYNDTFGHELGDYVLVRFSKMLMERVRNYGHAVRYGGDEFVVILDEKDIQFAKDFAKDILKQLKEVVLNDIHERVGKDVIIPTNKKLTCSIGIAECKDSNYVSEALKNADMALYHVKKTTKNDYVVWEEINHTLTEN